jgi:preflagellin peptidase FlaK
MSEILEGARISLCLSLLAYASWSDYKTREVSNSVWILFAPLAFALTFVDLYLYEPSGALFSYGISFGLTVAFATILFYTGAFGGADAKALMCLALALPFYPGNLLTPLFGESPISQVFFPFTIFANSVLLAAMTAVYMLLHNVFWHKKTGRKIFEGEQQKEPLGKKILTLVTGYKVSLSKLKQKWHVYPMEDVEETDGELGRRLVIIPKDEDRDAIVGRLTKAVDAGKIQDMIWATPGLPMLIFITAGLIIALFFGDIIWICISFLLR